MGIYSYYAILSLKGTLEERGMIAWKKGKTNHRTEETLDQSCYDLPFQGFKYVVIGEGIVTLENFQ